MSKLELEVKPLQKVLRKFNEDLGTYINDDQRFKLGRVLTIIDAAISDPEQRKAIKDLINTEWWSCNRVDRNLNSMVNPHTDIRGICQLFGFELYEQNELAVPMEVSESNSEHWSMKRYQKIALEEN